ncbi:hypothetical protein [Streptomyces uncialis]|uniref:hypothetical protein n=1 Tax=Streptomyces uncialis TaxID=1048205 RepID=UPI002F936ADB|nr:hypothetical protein OG924_37395 [Streptomyces uncialis]
MSRRFTVQYTDQAQDSLNRMSPAARACFETGMARLAGDPDGHGSTPAKSGREKDRRSATVAGFVVVYYVSRSVLVITALHIIGG